MTAEQPIQYWYARSGDSGLGRMHYSPVHWKGFVALFAAIMACIWVLLIGVLTIVFVSDGQVVIENVVLKFGAIALGAAFVVVAIWLAFYAFRTLRNRVDPVNNAVYYRKKFFGK